MIHLTVWTCWVAAITTQRRKAIGVPWRCYKSCIRDVLMVFVALHDIVLLWWFIILSHLSIHVPELGLLSKGTTLSTATNSTCTLKLLHSLATRRSEDSHTCGGVQSYWTVICTCWLHVLADTTCIYLYICIALPWCFCLFVHKMPCTRVYY